MTRTNARLTLSVVLASVCLSVVAMPTLGWSNGPNEGNGYGTHDWLIDQSVKVLDGRADGWFDAQAARLRSDDPDTIEVDGDRSREVEHVYRETGKRGGAVDRVAEHYSDAIENYEAGDYAAASEDIGLLSHFYADVLNTYHSTYAGIGNESYHKWYEELVDDLTGDANDQPEWSSAARSVSSIGNIRRSVIDAAAYSRKFYDRIHASMRANRTRLNNAADEATGYVFKYGARGLADIIYSVSLGVGKAPPAATLSAKVKWTGVAKGEDYQAAYMTAKDAKGRPIEGLAVRVERPTPGGGTVTHVAYTGPDGKAKVHWSVGATPLFTKRTVSLAARTGSATKAATTWYLVSPRLASGSAGFRTGMSDTTVKAGQLAKVTSRVRDTKGRPVPGLKVIWTWRIGSRTVVTSGITNARGRASSTYPVTSSTTRLRITIKATVQSASLNRNSSTSFRRN